MIQPVKQVRLAILSVTVSLMVCVAAAQDQPQVHERVPNVASLVNEAVFASADGEVEALVYEGRVIPMPGSGPPGMGEPMVSAIREPEGDALGTPEAPVFRADRQTSLESDVDYDTVFVPRISPFKRVFAYDQVTLGPDGRTPILTLSEPAYRPVPVTGSEGVAEEYRERFWGRIVADFSAGTRVRLPSVAPEARILQWRVEGPLEVRVERDGADAYYAVAERRHASPVRLVWLTDVAADYFSRPLHGGRLRPLAQRVRPMPAAVRRRALRLADQIGVPRDQGVAAMLTALTGHFRAFVESETPPRDTGNLLADLTLGRKGICRHRAYAFTVLAQALGIPTRLVHNEAHAWVEVELHEGDWLRIDLGGSAVGLRTQDSVESPRHRPSYPDPFPRPLAYQQSLAASRPQARPGTATSGAPMDPTGSSTSTASNGMNQVQDGRRPVNVRLFNRRYRVFRGRSLDIAGRVSDGDGQGIAGLRIEARLSGLGEVPLGVTVSRADGGFAATFGVPPNLGVGDYRLRVEVMGDEEWAPAVAP